VPFCNVTSIQRRVAATGESVSPLDFDALLTTWESRTGGGICFEVAGMVCRLLEELGYAAQVVLGQIAFPGSHQAVVVRLREGPYIVDLGCGEPLPEPIPLVRASEYHAAGLSYRFQPDLGAMTCVQERLIDGEWSPFCPYDLRPATDEAREEAYQRHHIAGETWVTTGITLVRYFEAEDELVALRNGRFTRYEAAAKHTEEVATDEEYERLVREGMRWPELPIVDALEALRVLRGVEPSR
jgi:arylamine N-acetyltransferase